jgi:integrase
MNTINFTKRKLESLPAPKQGRAIYHDSQTRGLGLLVQPSGFRSFFWYRKVYGQPTWKTIGPFPEWTVEQARGKAAEYNARWAQGEEPFTKPNTETFGGVFERYVEQHLGVEAKNPEKAKNAATGDVNRYCPSWKARRLDSIEHEHIRALHRKILEEKGPYAANRTLQHIRAALNWAITESIWPGPNPAARVQLAKEEKRTRFAQPDELPRLFKALHLGPNRDLRDFVLLALFTGARRGDLLAMRWENIFLSAQGHARWEVPNPKNSEPYNIALVPGASRILAGRRKRTRSSPWVFPSHSRSGHVVDFKQGWERVRRRAGLEDLRIHDLRRTLGSWQAAAGTSLLVIGKSLGHKSSSATEIYARLALDPVRASVEAATTAMLAAAKTQPRKQLKAAAR